MVALGLAAFYCSSVTQAYFAPRGMAERMQQAGAAIDRVTSDNDLAIVVDDYGIMSPILLYFMHLKGWSFDVGDLTPQVVDNLRTLGARYFVTTQWAHFKQTRPGGRCVSGALSAGERPRCPGRYGDVRASLMQEALSGSVVRDPGSGRPRDLDRGFC